MLVKRIISITSVYFKNANPTLQHIINRKNILLSCHTSITTNKTPQSGIHHPLSKSMAQFYEFCTNIDHNDQKTSKRVLADSFGFSLNVEYFKNVGLTDKISIFLKILKNEQGQQMDISQINKISQIKQLLIAQINKLELSQQIKYYSYFVSGFKLWLYEDLSISIKNKQDKVAQFRFKLPKINDYFTNLKIAKDDYMTMQEVNNLLINFQCIPETQHYALLTIALPYLDKTNHQILVLFLADACYSSSIPKLFFDKLYCETDIQELQWPYIYYLYKFAKNYKQVYSPLLNLHTMNKNSRQPYYKRHLFKDIQYSLQTLKITDELINQSQLKQFVYESSYHLALLDRLVQDKRLETTYIVSLYNKFSEIMPIGNRNSREISANKDALVRELSPEILEFIRMQLKNIEPKYIYSISEKCVGEINLSILFLLQFFLKKILTTDIYFVLELSSYYPLVGQKIRSTIIMSTTLILKKIMTNFLELSQEQRRTPQNIALLKKIIYFIYSTRNNISKIISQSQEFRDYVIDYTLGLKKVDYSNLEELKFIYQVVSLVEKQNIQQFSEMCESIFIKYIQDVMKEGQPKSVINQTNENEEYILRIINLLIDHSPKINTQATKALLTNFINTKFIYQIKSVKKQGVFDLFYLFEKLNNISYDVYGLLLNNLSTFVIYTQSNKKFHLPRGPKSLYKEQFVAILKRAISKYYILRKIKQKDQLNILITMAIRFWNELNQTEIAKLLIIFGSPTLLNDKIKMKVKNINFTPQSLESIQQIDALKAFKYCNTKLFNILNQEKQFEMNFQIQDFDLTELNTKSAQEISQIFVNLEFYQEVLEDPKIMCQSYIPEPKTKDIKINSIYTCLKIFYKIRNSYDFKLNINSLNSQKDQVLDISDEIRYIKQNNLIRMDDLNEFKLGNYEIECNHTMIQGWYNYDSYDNLLEIYGFSNVGQTIENPYEKVLLSLFGDIGYIRQYTKKQTFFSDPVFAALNLGLQAEPQGSLIEVTKPDSQKPETIYFLCSNESSYKISSIFAYVFKKVGLEAYIVTSMNTRDQISEFLKKKFNLNQQQIERLKYKQFSEIDIPQEEQLEKISTKKQKSGKIEILSDKSLNMSD